MKPPAWRLDAAAYSHAFALQTRYRDEDGLGHINNNAVAGFYDEARSRLMQHIFSPQNGLERVRIVTADTYVRFMGEVFHPDEVHIGSAILRIGNASFQIAQGLFQNGRCVGICDTTFVQATEHGSVPISDRLRTVLESHLVKEA